MQFNKITPEIVASFEVLIGKENVFTDEATLEKHSTDQTGNLAFKPDIVLKPSTTEGVAALLKKCNQERIPVTVQGGRSGVSGAAVPVLGGVALSMEKFDKILKIDEENFQVTVEPAVITEQLQNVVKEKGLFYPPDPAGRGWSFIGGNIATNAGGLKAAKYGVTREYVLNLEIVLPNGEILWTGANTLKNSTGYNLTHLIIGSEGTLAVVTKIVLKLLPLPTHNLLMLALFDNQEDACAAVAPIFQKGVIPSALEFMDKNATEYAKRYIGDLSIDIDEKYGAQLLIEVDGNDINALQQDCEKIAEVLMQHNADNILFADNESQKNDLWRMRRNAGSAVLNLSKMRISEDTVVPRAQLPDLLRGVKKIADSYGLKLANVGHLGDGNMHVFLLSDEVPDEALLAKAYEAKKEVFILVKSLNGMLSAEHGVGYIQKNYMPIFFSELHLDLLRGIKKVFDPNGILNPEKVF
jgi:glycolate oxidase